MILHIIQARSTSTRLPNKILQKIGDKTLLELHLENTTYNIGLNRIYPHEYTTVIATPFNEPKLIEIKKIAKKYGIEVFNPNCNENDVLKRYVLVSNEYEPDWIIRTTSDCLHSSSVMRRIVNMSMENHTRIFHTFDEGSCTEVFKYSDLLRADSELPKMSFLNVEQQIFKGHLDINNEQLLHRENVTSYFRKGFKKESIDTIDELNEMRKKYGRS